MSKCECLDWCPFFNDKLENMPALSEFYKQKYCTVDYNKCARYMVFKDLGKEKVQNDLFPNIESYAKKLINKINSYLS